MKDAARIRSFFTGAALGAAIIAVPAFAQAPPSDQCGAAGIPTYTTWQSGWNTWQYDTNHVMLGTVGGFTPYRLTVLSRQGDSQVIDLKPGTAIFPTGQTPSSGEHVAVVGYWSQGTFIANRVILRP